MRVALGADHGGFHLKRQLMTWLRARGHTAIDLGTYSPAPCDYPRVGAKVAQALARREAERGILLCKSGVGIAIVANKVAGIRAAPCRDVRDARLSRAHNNANILVLGATRLTVSQARRILSVWLKTPFEQRGRHARRVRQIAQFERQLRRHRRCPR